jgi:hypothetical protein
MALFEERALALPSARSSPSGLRLSAFQLVSISAYCSC